MRTVSKVLALRRLPSGGNLATAGDQGPSNGYGLIIEFGQGAYSHYCSYTSVTCSAACFATSFCGSTSGRVVATTNMAIKHMTARKKNSTLMPMT